MLDNDFERPIDRFTASTEFHRPASKHPHLKTFALGLGSFVIALPTGFLNFLGSLDIDLGSINNIHQLAEELDKKGAGELFKASLSGTVSTALNTGVNIVYIPGNVKTTGITFMNLGKKTFNALSPCGEKPFDTSHIDNTELLINMASFAYAFLPALTYAAIGSQEVSFLNDDDSDDDNPDLNHFLRVLRVSVVLLNFLTAYVTRFNGISYLFNLAFNPNHRFVAKMLRRIENCTEAVAFHVDVEASATDVTDALAILLKQINQDRNLPLSSIQGQYYNYSRSDKAKYITRILLGMVLAAVFSPFIWPVVAFDTLKGFEIISNNPWFSKNQYQGDAQLAFGWFTSLPNPAFYVKANLELPGILATSFGLFKNAVANNFTGLFFAMVTLYLLFGGGALWSGEGMGDVSQSAIDEGYLDYMGKVVIPFLYVFSSWGGAANINGGACFKILNDYFLKKLDGEVDEAPTHGISQITTKDAKRMLENPKVYEVDVPRLRHSVESHERSIKVSSQSQGYGTFFGPDDSKSQTAVRKFTSDETATFLI